MEEPAGAELTGRLNHPLGPSSSGAGDRVTAGTPAHRSQPRGAKSVPSIHTGDPPTLLPPADPCREPSALPQFPHLAICCRLLKEGNTNSSPEQTAPAGGSWVGTAPPSPSITHSTSVPQHSTAPSHQKHTPEPPQADHRQVTGTGYFNYQTHREQPLQNIFIIHQSCQSAFAGEQPCQAWTRNSPVGVCVASFGVSLRDRELHQVTYISGHFHVQRFMPRSV